MRNSRLIKVRNFTVGGNSPVRVESMLKSPLDSLDSNLKELKELKKAGCELVRIAIPNKKSLEVYEKLKKEVSLPLMGDFHFSSTLIKEAVEKGMEMVRINPGNLKESTLKELVTIFKRNHVLVRIGVNSASFSPPLPPGEEGAREMVEILKKWVGTFEKFSHPFVICSLKSSDVKTTILANQIFSRDYDYPLHLGITEAGGGLQGVVKSSVGIGILLWNGIGDTVRVSLTGPSQEEVEVAYEILKSLGIRKRGPEFISCPTCGRARINVRETMEKVREFTLPYTDELSGLKIAVMGCEVNGPGEAREADLGLAGGKTYSLFFKKGEIIRKVRKEDMVKAFKYELKKLL